MITSEQVRMALGALRWSRSDLAARAGLSRVTIQRLTDAKGVPARMATGNLAAVQAALEAGDGSGRCEFIPGGVLFHPGGE